MSSCGGTTNTIGWYPPFDGGGPPSSMLVMSWMTSHRYSLCSLLLQLMAVPLPRRYVGCVEAVHCLPLVAAAAAEEAEGCCTGAGDCREQWQSGRTAHRGRRSIPGGSYQRRRCRWSGLPVVAMVAASSLALVCAVLWRLPICRCRVMAVMAVICMMAVMPRCAGMPASVRSSVSVL